MKEKIFKCFSPPYFGGRKYILIYFHHRILVFGGENIFKFIFTSVFLGEKIYLNIFSPPYFLGRKYIQIYFHHRIFGGENIFIISEKTTTNISQMKQTDTM